MTHDDDVLLEVSNLRVALDHEVIIDGLSFTLSRGEILTVLGPNGAGKTVLLRTLLGVLPHEGSIRWREGTRIGYVPQRLPYIRDIPVSVEEFFALKSKRSEAAEILEATGLSGSMLGKRMGDLSSGQFQRVLIAWALAGDPHVLLFDEPTTGVDIKGEESVYALLARLHESRDLAMLLVTHDLAVVYKLSTSVLCLNRSTVCHGTPVEVLTPENLQRLYGTEVKYYGHAQG